MRTQAYIHQDNIEEKTNSWLRKIRSAVAPRPHLQFKPSEAALIVIDMNNYFCAETGSCYLPAAAPVIPQIRKLIDVFEHHDGNIIYTRHGHEGDHDKGMIGRFFGGYIKFDSIDSQIIAELEPSSSHCVIQKKTYDSFIETSLGSILENNNIKQVLIAGVLTHMCCETTARAAFCRGFEVYVCADATATTTEERHLNSLLAMADALAKIMSVDEVLELCKPTK